MTLEEMQAIARDVVAALNAAGFNDVAYDADHAAGDPLPIMFIAKSGDECVLELSPL